MASTFVCAHHSHEIIKGETFNVASTFVCAHHSRVQREVTQTFNVTSTFVRVSHTQDFAIGLKMSNANYARTCQDIHS